MEKTLGTINFESRQPGRFTEDEAEAAEAFAAEISDTLRECWAKNRRMEGKSAT